MTNPLTDIEKGVFALITGELDDEDHPVALLRADLTINGRTEPCSVIVSVNMDGAGVTMLPLAVLITTPDGKQGPLFDCLDPGGDPDIVVTSFLL